ncbi:MAG: 4Fe-4S dicluster domain-containing protein [Nitrososphaerota archaeon]
MLNKSKDISNQKVLIYNPEKCTGCLLCMIACSYKHFNVFDLNKTHIKIFKYDGEEYNFIGVYCAHCDEPACVASCPVEAITKEVQSGWIKINSIKCILCKSCIYGCPISHPWFIEDYKKMVKCDFCDGDPYCAKFCPTEAIQVKTRKEAYEFMERNKKLIFNSE